LKTNPVVIEAINNFVKQQFSMTGPTSNRVVSKEEYFRVFVKIGMVLRPGIEVDDLTKIIKEDFDNDSQDKVDADEKNGDGQPPK
jgi:hypothetical protein